MIGPHMRDKPKGLKDDHGKIDFSLVDDDADAEVAAVLTHGAEKYARESWSAVEHARDRYYAAARRHLRASRKGEIIDAGTNLFTLASAACNVHFLLALELRAHPELAASLPERLTRSLEIARALRAERDAREAAISSAPKKRTRSRKKTL